MILEDSVPTNYESYADSGLKSSSKKGCAKKLIVFEIAAEIL